MIFRNFIFRSRRLVGLEKLLVLQGEVRAHQIRQIGPLKSLADAEFSVFSQWGEDGILSWLIDLINPSSNIFIEFGVEDYRESNTRYLLMTRSWSGLVIDGSEDYISAIKTDDISYKYDIESVNAFIDRENINSLLDKIVHNNNIGLLSVDIDGVDYWILENILCRSAIIAVEYNAVFGEYPVSVPYDPTFDRRKKHASGMYWGASLAAFRHLLEERNYIFAGTNRAGTNAFFVDAVYEERISAALKGRIEWPCRMREVRNMNGQLSFRRYDQERGAIADLPVVNVVSGKTHRAGECWGDD